jgi:hypothetical protein
MWPHETRCVRPQRHYGTPLLHGGTQQQSNDKYLRPTRWYTARGPEVVAMANELEAYKLPHCELGRRKHISTAKGRSAPSSEPACKRLEIYAPNEVGEINKPFDEAAPETMVCHESTLSSTMKSIKALAWLTPALLDELAFSIRIWT